MNYLCVCPLITFYLQTSRSFFEINFFICCLERRGSMKLCSGRVLIGRCSKGISKPPKNGVSMNFEPAVGVTKTLMILFICETISLPSIDSNRFPCEMKNTWTTEKILIIFHWKRKWSIVCQWTQLSSEIFQVEFHASCCSYSNFFGIKNLLISIQF